MATGAPGSRPQRRESKECSPGIAAQADDLVVREGAELGMTRYLNVCRSYSKLAHEW